MDTKVSCALLVLLTSSYPTTIFAALEIEQFPEQTAVEIKENATKILRFQVQASSLEKISIQYGINGTREKYHAIGSFNYNAAHSAVAMSCNINNTYNCTELYIRVDGRQENNNTSFHLVLIEMLHLSSFRQLDIPNFFRVHISTASTTVVTTTQPATTTPLATTSHSASTTPYIITTTRSASLPNYETTSPLFSPTAKPSTTMPTDTGDNTSQGQNINRELILFTALASSIAALFLSCIANCTFLCCLVRRHNMMPHKYAETGHIS